jgi:hypothetical protein
LSGCTLPSKFEVFNNTGIEVRIIQVISEDKKSFDLAANTSMTLENWDDYGDVCFTIMAGNKQWHYTPEYISHEFGKLRRFSHWLFKVQIEKDSSVFVLGPEKEFPQIKHIAQPEGYTLRPVDENV